MHLTINHAKTQKVWYTLLRIAMRQRRKETSSPLISMHHTEVCMHRYK